LKSLKIDKEKMNAASALNSANISSAQSIFQHFNSILSVTTPENKNLWLSIIESAGDSLINLLTLKDEDNGNIWLSWFREQCKRLDQLSEDLMFDIEEKINKMDNKKAVFN
jgi:hypothetical protein